jgi:hypothetical protein
MMACWQASQQDPPRYKVCFDPERFRSIHQRRSGQRRVRTRRFSISVTNPTFPSPLPTHVVHPPFALLCEMSGTYRDDSVVVLKVVRIVPEKVDEAGGTKGKRNEQSSRISPSGSVKKGTMRQPKLTARQYSQSLRNSIPCVKSPYRQRTKRPSLRA